jgi:hypothetical protein
MLVPWISVVNGSGIEKGHLGLAEYDPALHFFNWDPVTIYRVTIVNAIRLHLVRLCGADAGTTASK